MDKNFLIRSMLIDLAIKFNRTTEYVTRIYNTEANRSMDKTIEILSTSKWELTKDYVTHHSDYATITQQRVKKVILRKGTYSYIEVCISEKTTPDFEVIATLTAQRIANVLNNGSEQL